jgi:3-dehydroquinate synthase
MAIVTKASASNRLCSYDVYQTLISLLRRFSLPIGTDFTAEALFASALSDKKCSGSTVNLIIPRRIGHCDIIPTPVLELESFIKAGL